MSQICLSTAFAQEVAGNDADLTGESVNDFYVVAGMGVAGAVLGLSTISFQGDPSISKHGSRVQSGTALGIIIGVIVVAMSQAERSTKYFGQSEQASLYSPKDFHTPLRTKWHNDGQQVPIQAPIRVGHSWSF